MDNMSKLKKQNFLSHGAPHAMLHATFTCNMFYLPCGGDNKSMRMTYPCYNYQVSISLASQCRQMSHRHKRDCQGGASCCCQHQQRLVPLGPKKVDFSPPHWPSATLFFSSVQLQNKNIYQSFVSGDCLHKMMKY